jgi:hypothetical protein
MTMAKKSKHRVRPDDEFQLGLEWPDGRKVRVYVLREGESIPTRTSTNYDHHWHGPCLVYTELSPQGWKTHEHHVDDAGTWKWISTLVRDGVKDGLKVISPCQDR